MNLTVILKGRIGPNNLFKENATKASQIMFHKIRSKLNTGHQAFLSEHGK